MLNLNFIKKKKRAIINEKRRSEYNIHVIWFMLYENKIRTFIISKNKMSRKLID